MAPIPSRECEPKGTDFNRGEIFRVLKAGGFSGVLNQKVQLTKIGAIEIKNTCLNLYVYTFTSESKGGPKGARHMATRLLILSNTEYLGMYPIDELPTGLVGNTLEFPGSTEEGNSIVFSNEVPPEKIYLGGEVRRLFK
jgi:hypothetical protein